MTDLAHAQLRKLIEEADVNRLPGILAMLMLVDLSQQEPELFEAIRGNHGDTIVRLKQLIEKWLVSMPAQRWFEHAIEAFMRGEPTSPPYQPDTIRLVKTEEPK